MVRCTQQSSHGLGSISRREVSLAAAALAFVFSPSAAHAGLFGDGGESKYQEETSKIISDALTAVALDKNAPNREDILRAVKDEINAWVARYRRDQKFSGRPSYSNTYTALNALAGHLNSFGYTTGIPAKRLERMQKELNDAASQLSRGR